MMIMEHKMFKKVLNVDILKNISMVHFETLTKIIIKKKKNLIWTLIKHILTMIDDR